MDANDQSGQIELTDADTVYQGPAARGHLWEITGHPDNAGSLYIGRKDASVSSTTGYYLGADKTLVVEVPILSDLYFISDEAGDRVTIIRGV